jgi:three-Cys-motif partner protein
VGEWAEDKHDYLSRYIEATWAVRSKWLPPKGTGGAAFLDLFAGPGRARLRQSGRIVDGSPLIALKHAKAPFSRAILCDLDPENVASLRQRTLPYGRRVDIIGGDCNERIDAIVATVPSHGQNIALIDPFGARVLRFDTIRKLAALKWMDLLIHFPTNTIKRNFATKGFDAHIDALLGTQTWRQHVKSPPEVVPHMIDLFRKQLGTLGYTQVKTTEYGSEIRTPAIKNNQQGLLYHLVFASKHDRGDKIWNSIAKTDAHGNRDLF